jgi:phosphodiesterase/alkaline phosphatase D-like protein
MIRKSSFHRYAFALMLLPSISIFLTNCGGGGGGDSAAPDLSPAAATSPATSVNNNSAVLNAVVNPKGLSTTAFFEYGKDPGLATVTPTAVQLLGSGSADIVVTQSIPAVLDEGATYYFRVKATNSAGTKVGPIVPFSTLPLPKATTNPVTSITTSGATLNAIVNPNGRATNAWFEYGTTSSLGFIFDNASRGSGTDNVTINSALSPLTPATQYFYRIVANNSVGTSPGSTLTFTTAGGVPEAFTRAATSINDNGATLNADVNPSGLATNAWFEWSTDNTFTTFNETTHQAIGSSTANVAVTFALSGRAPGVKIYYRAAASNVVGPSLKGDPFNFTTSNPTTVTTLPVSSLGAIVATLNGSVTPNGLATTAWFEYGTDPNLTTSFSTTNQPLGSETSNVAVNATLSGLSTETTHYFRLAASNSAGTTRGSILSFTTGAATTVTTLPVSSLGAIVATLNGSVTPPGLETAAWFEYGTDPLLNTSISTASQPLGSGTANVPFNETISGLSAGNITYYFRVAASNSAGTTRGSILSFTTNWPTFYHDFGFTGNQATDTGVFSVDFCPTAKHSPGGQFVLRLMDDFNTYFEISNYDWDNPADPHPQASVRKVRSRATVDEVMFTNSYSQGNCYTIKITFSPTFTTVEAFGETMNLTANDTSFPVWSFMVETTNQDATLANITPPVHF